MRRFWARDSLSLGFEVADADRNAQNGDAKGDEIGFGAVVGQVVGQSGKDDGFLEPVGSRVEPGAERRFPVLDAGQTAVDGVQGAD